MTPPLVSGPVELRERDGVVELRCNGWELMSSRAHHSEQALAELACGTLPISGPAVLLAGLGLGYTLRALLDRLPVDASVTVVELLPEVIDWNSARLAHLAGRPLDDPRVAIVCADVLDTLQAAVPHSFDAILLDVDNGPEAIMFPGNAALYAASGLQRIGAVLRRGGTLAVWSADRSPRFEHALACAGFASEAYDVAARGTADDPRHTIYLARTAA